ncbi:malto-oligosyltrehalose trehalohydrolase [Nocardioides rotundus]|nr:malto-oligosyltrehalose trehalohydrolase [Nocardioides rotundus]
MRGRFDVWAPRAERVRLSVGDAMVEMRRHDDGWWTPDRSGGAPIDGEVDYGYVIDDGETPLPDPRSRRQPDGVHGRSRTFDPTAHTWGDAGWTGRQVAGAVIYELHVGTFTPEGTLDSAIDRLDHLADLGVDLVEVMPVNAFNGPHGWGYDGVAWFAVHEEYGGPAAYQRFVDACHARGIGVVQDVVYNHLGPSGNYLPRFGPYLTDGATDWGDQVNLDGEGSAEVRRLILDNVRMWFADFHVDALRLDAVHALKDDSATHLLAEMATEVDALSTHLRRPLSLVAESDLNDPTMITPREAGGLGMTGQWSDDFHHAVHVALTGETAGYYADFEPLSALVKVLERGFFHDGTWSSFRGRQHGVPIDTERMPAWRLVVAAQNHDQVGNRARGDRLTETLDEDQLGCAALLLLTAPFTPMLFQGEEWGARTPFAFFTSHPEEELGRAVSEGRTQEFARMGWNLDEVPDPQDPETFRRSKLDWSEPAGAGAGLLALHTRLIELRRTLPALTDPRFSSTSVERDERARTLRIRRGTGSDAVLILLNLGVEPATFPAMEGYGVAATTASGADLADGELRLPAHGGALLAPDRLL